MRCGLGRVLGAFSANSPEPTVPPLCLRTGPHFPDIRWRNSQPLVSGNFIRCYCRSVI